MHIDYATENCIFWERRFKGDQVEILRPLIFDQVLTLAITENIEADLAKRIAYLTTADPRPKNDAGGFIFTTEAQQRKVAFALIQKFKTARNVIAASFGYTAAQIFP